jgi:uncharacterized repeat protein (TIGR03803 family)
MQCETLFSKLRTVATILVAALCLTSAWAADRETVLYSFGADPSNGVGGSTLIRDSAGNLYGVSGSGGPYQCGISTCGIVFELSRAAGGGWTQAILHSFGNGSDGSYPNGLMMDAAGNLYGVTESGGLNGAGIAYELSPSPGGGWTEAVLYNFSRGGLYGNGTYNLVKDAAGNLYGTAIAGGAYGWGSVFELSPGQGGTWTLTELYSFGNGHDGQAPESGVVMDAAGNLYGTTYQGGTNCPSLGGCGIVYELSPGQGGNWTETVLHNFNLNDGFHPWATMIMDASGNLYGTTEQGGTNCAPFGCGTVFELSPGDGGWIETVLHSFNNDLVDGYSPLAPLIWDSNGNLYGTTLEGGSQYYGVVFELSPRGDSWKETILHKFNNLDNGVGIFGAVVMDRAGNLYGTTGYGGIYDYGVAFELTPTSIRPSSSAAR